MVRLDLLMDQTAMKAVWKSASAMSGGLCVTRCGTPLKLLSSANNLTLLILVRIDILIASYMEIPRRDQLIHRNTIKLPCFRINHFVLCKEVVLFGGKYVLSTIIGDMDRVLCSEVVP